MVDITQTNLNYLKGLLNSVNSILKVVADKNILNFIECNDKTYKRLTTIEKNAFRKYNCSIEKLWETNPILAIKEADSVSSIDDELKFILSDNYKNYILNIIRTLCLADIVLETNTMTYVCDPIKNYYKNDIDNIINELETSRQIYNQGKNLFKKPKDLKIFRILIMFLCDTKTSLEMCKECYIKSKKLNNIMVQIRQYKDNEFIDDLILNL